MSDVTVLFLPGTLCTADVFAAQAKALAPHVRDIRIPEFRLERSIEAMADTAARLLPRQGRAAVAGFSMGGMVAMALAACHPDRVDRLALINTNTHPERPDRRAERTERIAEARRSSVRAVVESSLLQHYLYRQEPGHRERILDMAEAHGIDAFEAQTQALAERPDSGPILEALDCPVLILGARHDRLCPPESQHAMLERARHGRLTMLEECGHFSLLEQADTVNRALLDWLETGQ